MNSSEACLLGTLSPEAPVVSPQQRLCQDLPAARGWGRAGTAGRAKNRVHACLGRCAFESYLSPIRAEVVSNRGPGLRWAAPPPGLSTSKEATQRLPKKTSPSWSPSPLATCCMASNAAGRPPGSPPGPVFWAVALEESHAQVSCGVAERSQRGCLGRKGFVQTVDLPLLDS